jgi:Ca2+-binding RTX toxin-like protein
VSPPGGFPYCGNDVVGVNLTFDDAAGPIPPEATLASGTYQPTDNASTANGCGFDDDPFAGPAPGGPYGSTLAVFNGTNPNGVWSLYVVDDAGGDSGSLASGWSIDIEAPAPAPAPAPAAVAAAPTCKGKQATIVGTGSSELLKGTSGKDVIVGLGGNDKLSGLGGNDLICGGAGKDTLKGGQGNDKLFGQKGNDTLKGGPGKDKLKGGAGKDKQIQ